MTYRKQAVTAIATGFLLLVLGLVSAVASERATTTVYVGRHFEVRDHDQPVKYVFTGDTRVARITGSLSSNSRIQRLRLQLGWNHCSVAVGDAPLPVRAEIDQAYRWNSITGQYEPVGVQDTLAAGSVLWIKANAPAAINLNGTYVAPVPTTWPAGATFVGGAGLEAMSLALPPGVTVWKFDAASQNWRAGLAGDLAIVKELPPRLAPGEAIYVHTAEPAAAPLPDPAQRIAYYHQDHLGSSSAVTDAGGALVEETAYYPFGATRHQERLRQIEAHYQFTQKELDTESGLQYFGQRYLYPAIGRWISPDPMGERGGGLNPYAYVNQSPLKHYDPNGAEVTVVRIVDKKTRTTTYEIQLKAAFIDVSSEKFTQQEVAAFAANLKSQIETSYSGQGKGDLRDEKTNKVLAKNWNYKWSASVDLRAINNWKEVEKDDHVFRRVDTTKTGARGESAIGGMLIDLKASIFNRSGPNAAPEETGAHEVGHTAGLHHANDAPNLMMDGGLRPEGARNISLGQIQEIWKASSAGQLNQRDKTMSELDEIANRR